MRKHIKQSPKVGAVRNKVKFAWLPRKVGKGTYVIWLERYISMQQYRVITKKQYYASGLPIGTHLMNEWVETGTSLWAGDGWTIITNR